MLRYSPNQVLDTLDEDKVLDASLYAHYGQSLRRAIDSVFTQSAGGLPDRLRANAARFAAYKAAYVQRTLRAVAEDGSIEDKEQAMRAALRTFDRYTDAERNTAAARARTAKQFEHFLDPDNMRLFPCLRWLPSRSAAPRAEHTAFYNRIWRKDDPFWNSHQPGTEWNCKCDLEETDEPATEGNDTLQMPSVPRGLEGNPALSGEIFTDRAPYIRHMQRQAYEVEGAARGMSLQYWRTNTEFKEQLTSQKATCTVNGKRHEVSFAKNQIDEALHSYLDNSAYVLKNECMHRLPEILEDATFIGWKEVERTHNKPKSKAAKFKSHAERFEYYQTQLPDGTDLFIHIGLMENGARRFYTVTMDLDREGLRK